METKVTEEEGSPTGRARGGVARANSLTPQRRKEIAARAAAARWGGEVPNAIFGSPNRPVRIGNIELQCYVLDDDEDTRVLTQAEFLEALGRHRKANVRNEGDEERIPPILQGKSIKRFISQELLEKSRPVKFRLPGGVVASGYRAEVLPMVCDVYLQARDADELPPNQRHVAKQAEILIRALAHVGIIALVDEATGYQRVRDKLALQAILDAYLRKELAAWAKRFPVEFYRQIFRLREWEWKGMKVNRPQVVAKYTKDFVYERLAPGILDELETRMPKDERGRKKGKLHQLFTDDIGHPALAQHLHAVTALMTAARNWDEFKRMINAALPKKGANLRLPFVEEI
jgi:P63C domain-containing protein